MENKKGIEKDIDLLLDKVGSDLEAIANLNMKRSSHINELLNKMESTLKSLVKLNDSVNAKLNKNTGK